MSCAAIEVPFPENRRQISRLTKFLLIDAKLNLVKVRSAFIDSKINRLPPQGFEHDFNFKKYSASAAVVDRKSVTIIDTQLDNYVTT